MAAGDGNRVWFPQMIETLRSQWNGEMPFPVLIELCNILDAMFQRRRPRSCLQVLAVRNAGKSWVPKVSNVTASAFGQLFLSLGRFGIASPEVTKRTEKEWARYRAENRLDLYGRRITSTAERVGKEPICAHATPEE